MKKIFVVCLVLTMAACMSLNAFALPGVFVESPSNNQAPELVEGKVNCDADVVITAETDQSLVEGGEVRSEAGNQNTLVAGIFLCML